jgi:signal transduction histidine kinase
LEKSNTFNAEEFLASVLNYAPLGIISVDESGRISHTNRLAKVLLQISPPNRKISGMPFLDCISNLPLLCNILSGFLEKNKSFHTEAININDRYIIIKGVRIQNEFILFINEVTRLREMETESIQSIIAGQEKERRRIAREIHDGIGPLLSYSKLELDAFLDEYEDHHKHAGEEKLVNIRQTLDSITNDLRDLSHHLIPRLLEEFGLFSAFNNLITRLNNSIKPNVEFYCNIGSEVRFDPDLELNLYRCGQELVNNVVKHAKASEILVQLIKHDHSIVLMVEDDGIGFEQLENNPQNFGIGLTNIETRVRTFNGEFIIESRLNRGTTASIEIPLSSLKNEQHG